MDGLRGIAALVVVLHHFSFLRLVPYGTTLGRYFDLGIYGVMLFFIISGWIVPTSLHRRGDVRAFWIGRLFRIYPLIIVTVVLATLLPDGYSPVHQQLRGDQGWGLLANSTLLADLLGTPSALSVLWTLTFEMVFYYLVAALFVVRWHEHSLSVAAWLAVAAAVLGGIGGHAFILSQWTSAAARHLLTAITAAGLVIGLGLVLHGRERNIRNGSLLLAGLGLVLVLGNARAPLFEVLTILAAMFGGTVVNALQRNAMDRLTGISICLIVVFGGAVAGYAHNRGAHGAMTWTDTWQAFTLPYLAAWATFGIGILLSRREWPRVATWLGAVSYSLYIVHVPAMWFVYWIKDALFTLPGGMWGTALLMIPKLAITFGMSQLTYRYVELPGQRLGKKLTAAVSGRTSR